MKKNHIDEYVELKLQEKRVKQRLSEISPDITTWVQESGGFVELEDGGELKIVTRKDWQYPKYLSKKVKTLKKEATTMEKIYKIKNPEKWEPAYNLRFDEPKR